MKLFAKILFTLCWGLLLLAPNPVAASCPFDQPGTMEVCQKVVLGHPNQRQVYTNACRYLEELVEQLCQVPYPRATIDAAIFAEVTEDSLSVTVVTLDDDGVPTFYITFTTSEDTQEELKATAKRIGGKMREDYAPKPPPGATKLQVS